MSARSSKKWNEACLMETIFPPISRKKLIACGLPKYARKHVLDIDLIFSSCPLQKCECISERRAAVSPATTYIQESTSFSILALDPKTYFDKYNHTVRCSYIRAPVNTSIIHLFSLFLSISHTFSRATRIYNRPRIYLYMYCNLFLIINPDSRSDPLFADLPNLDSESFNLDQNCII